MARLPINSNTKDNIQRSFVNNKNGEASVSVVADTLPDFTEQPVYGNIDVTNTATALRVGVANYDGRRIMIVQPKGKTIYLGWDSNVTAGNNGNGIKVSSGTIVYISIIGDLDVYAITSSGTAKTHVTEGK